MKDLHLHALFSHIYAVALTLPPTAYQILWMPPSLKDINGGVRSNWDRSSQARAGQVKMGQFKLEQVESGIFLDQQFFWINNFSGHIIC